MTVTRSVADPMPDPMPDPISEPMLPVPYRVVARREETGDVVTLTLMPVSTAIARVRPGQFTMLYRHGVGEVAVSVSGDPSAGAPALVQTVRDVGAVTRALCGSRPGDLVGVRGPFGVGWSGGDEQGSDLVIVAGGLGLAPLRPLLLQAMSRRGRRRRVVLVAGARSPDELLYPAELDAWSSGGGVEVHVTVDRGGPGWTGRVGLVTGPLGELLLDPARTRVALCGPEPMMRACARLLVARGVPAAQIEVSLERNMQCGIGLCGHCQLGPVLVCRDGPVLDYARARPLLETREL